MQFFYKKAFLFLLIFSIGLMVISCSDTPQSNQMKIDRIASDMKQQLPKMLDNDTKLVNVYTKPMELISEYEMVNYASSEGDNQNMKNKIEFYLIKQVCPNIKKEFLEKGISARYIYKGKDGLIIVERLLSTGDC